MALVDFGVVLAVISDMDVELLDTEFAAMSLEGAVWLVVTTGGAGGLDWIMREGGASKDDCF